MSPILPAVAGLSAIATPAKNLNNTGGGLEGYAIFLERNR